MGIKTLRTIWDSYHCWYVSGDQKGSHCMISIGCLTLPILHHRIQVRIGSHWKAYVRGMLQYWYRFTRYSVVHSSSCLIYYNPHFPTFSDIFHFQHQLSILPKSSCRACSDTEKITASSANRRPGILTFPIMMQLSTPNRSLKYRLKSMSS